MTYTGPPAPRDSYETYRHATGRSARADLRGQADTMLLPVHIAQSLFRLVWWMSKTLYRLMRRR